MKIARRLEYTCEHCGSTSMDMDTIFKCEKLCSERKEGVKRNTDKLDRMDDVTIKKERT